MRPKSLFLALAAGVILVLALSSPAGRGGKTNAAPPRGSASVELPPRYLYLGQELSQPRSQYEIDWLLRRKKSKRSKRVNTRYFTTSSLSTDFAESGITFQDIRLRMTPTNYKADSL
jgi:hypothetical protein